MGLLAALSQNKGGRDAMSAVSPAYAAVRALTKDKPKGMDAGLGQSPLGIAKNGNLAGGLQATQGQRSYLTGGFSGKTVLGA